MSQNPPKDVVEVASHSLFVLPVKTLAARIDAHLKKWEADPTINVRLGTRGLRKYYDAGAWAAGRWVGVRYISYQSASKLTKRQAANYLAMIETGFVGSHYRISDANAKEQP